VPEKYASPKVFKAVVIATMIFSIPDFLGSIGLGETIAGLQPYIPLSKFSLGWVLPSVVVFVSMNIMPIKSD
jgi:LIVCS family branched-chain amino acid:cation transporter